MTLLHRHTGSGRAFAPMSQRDYVRSPHLIQACRMIPCQHCGANDGTIRAAHSNAGEHGNGRGIMASDQFVAALCAFCHDKLEQTLVMSCDAGRAMWRAAWRKTVTELVERKLWPDDVPTPR